MNAATAHPLGFGGCALRLPVLQNRLDEEVNQAGCFVRKILMAAAFSIFAVAPALGAPKEKSLTVEVANPEEYAVPVEAFRLGKTEVKPYHFAFTAGGYIYASSTVLKEKAYREGLFKNWTENDVTVDFLFTKLDSAPLLSGRCFVSIKLKSGGLKESETNPYTCQFGEASATEHSFDAVVPDLVLTNEDEIISIQRDDSKKYEALRASMQYKGVAYTAAPTGLTPSREAERRRVANGYLIRRDGALVGRIDFPNYRGVIYDEHGAYQRKSVITAPITEDDGREAVIFFAAQLLALPEANTAALK